MAIGLLLAFIIYFSILVGIGIAAYRFEAMRVQESEQKAGDFLVGGRSLNFWVTALSAHASDMSNWLFMAYPAAIYLYGPSQIWIAVGLVLFMFLNWHYIAPKLRVATEESGSHTLAAYFEHRFSDTSGMIRIIAAVMSLLFFTIYLSAGLNGIGLLCESAFLVPYHIGIIFGLAVMVIYTFLGGYVAVAWTDLFQGLFLLCMIMIVPVYAFFVIGSTHSIVLAAAARNLSLAIIPSYSMKGVGDILFIVLGWGLGYFGLPHVLTKFMGIKDPDEMYKSKYVGIAWQILTLGAATAVGLVAIAYFSSGMVHNPELIFISMVQDLFSPFFGGFILCAILAATISTIDSQMLVVAGVLTDDLYKGFFRKNATTKELLAVFRASIILIALIAALIALGRMSTIYELVWYAWTGLGATFGPLVVLSLYSKAINRYGAIAGLLWGGIIAAMWDPFLSKQLLIAVPAMIPGFFGGMLMIYLVSFLTRNIR